MKSIYTIILISILFFYKVSFSQTQTTPNTYFIDGNTTFNGIGSYWTQQFTINSQRTFVLRFTSQYASDAAIFLPSQLTNFRNNQAFTGYALFDNQYGTQRVTINAGTYYIGMRSQSNGTFPSRLELDYDISLPLSDSCQFIDINMQGNQTLQPGQKIWHQFTFQGQYRYFLDGCNSGGLSVYTIPQSSLSAFQNNQSFFYYTSYSGFNDGANPGLWEISGIPAGVYYFAVKNTSSQPQTLTYTMERWRKNYVGIEQISTTLPEKFELYQNYPNPFNPITKIKLDIRKSGLVKLRIFDILGKEIAIPINQNLNAGSYLVDFDGSDLVSGTYFYQIETAEITETKKMILNK